MFPCDILSMSCTSKTQKTLTNMNICKTDVTEMVIEGRRNREIHDLEEVFVSVNFKRYFCLLTHYRDS